MVNTIFICSKCDSQYPKWSGRCLECGSWGTIAENKKQITKSKAKKEIKGEAAKTVSFSNSEFKISNFEKKLKTDFDEVNKVLGGGITTGSVILLGGDPGVGKSTLALQLAAGLGAEVLYVSAEESMNQVGERLTRLRPLDSARGFGGLKFLNEDHLETILATLDQEKPKLTVIDSIQTVYSEEIQGSAGTLNQVKACAAKLVSLAKSENLSIILIGQVTKEGQLAGPKSIEHLVDAVLYLEGDQYKQYRLLRATKNRFGPTDEVAILEMTKEGLRPVLNPSKIFLSESHHQSGSVICAVAEGSQVFLVEVQALVSKSSFGYPKRSASGFEQKRLELLTTVLTKRAGINLANFDVYLNIAGGLNLHEPALDLAVAASIISAYQDKVFPEKSVIFGEAGLGGEVRAVTKTKERVKEAVRLGFKKIILPYFEGEAKGVDLIKIKEVREIILLLK